MTNSPNTVKTHRLRLIFDVLRIVEMSVILVLFLLVMSGGIRTLYQEWNALNSEDLEGLVPTPHQIYTAWETYQTDLTQTYIPATLFTTITGLSLAVVIGLLFATLMDFFPLVKWTVYPILVFSQTIPTFALAVILILVFGFGEGPKIVVVVLFCFFPITVSTLNGLQSVNPVHMSLLRSMGANPVQVWWKVRLPTAMPSFFSGLRLAATYSVVGAVIGEYVGAGDGLGKFLQRSYRSFKTDQVFLAVIIIALLSLMLVVLVGLIERLALRWRYSLRRR
jgi:ABC-type nitrate/sulfonate/bicarbonate transport system permease component